jgi:hypothetical protein
VKVRHDEGVANRIDPEPCDANREGCVEASVGEHIGQPWSRERLKYRAPTWSETRKATWTSALVRAVAQPGVVEDPGMCGSSLYGNREVSGLACGGMPQVRVGKTRSRSRRCTDPRSLTPS